MPSTDETEGPASSTEPLPRVDPERRQRGGGLIARRAAVHRAITKQRLEEFHETLGGLAVAVFGDQATVVAHLRTSAGRQWLTFVVDAADPVSVVQYDDFLPRERAFWTAYAQLVKPIGSQFIVAVRPARGWCRVEALAPLFSLLQPPELVT
jgi:hypothetical protein